MSCDLEVFSIGPPASTAVPQGRGWQITVDDPLPVEPGDIPLEVRRALPGVQFVTRLHLEGDASASIEKKLLTVARGLARSARGVIVDPQRGTIETGPGVRRLQTTRDGPAERLVQLSWFVHDVAPIVGSLSGGLLDTFQHTIPESLPRRYGLHEPPQFTLETEGVDHLRRFLEAHVRDAPIWYAHEPCRHLFISIPGRIGPTPRGFRCGRLTLDVDGTAAADRAWRVELTRLWLAVAELIQPFYAEVRTGECPTKSWWWNGIPAGTPSAVLIGEPYVGLWPDFVPASRSSRAGLRYVDGFVEGTSEARRQIPAPPARIAQPSTRPATFDLTKPGDMAAMLSEAAPRYPEVWPFDGPLA